MKILKYKIKLMKDGKRKENEKEKKFKNKMLYDITPMTSCMIT